MNNFRNSGPGGLRKRPEFIGGRPSSDANYGPKKGFDKKPSFGGKGGFKGGDRGGSRGGDRGGFGGNKGGFGGSRDGERREVTMHKATCSTCSKPCEVPFRPDGSKPVLCSECFGKNKSDDRNGFERRDRFSNDRPQRGGDRKFDAPRPERGPSPDIKALESKVSTLESKVDEILSLLKGEAPTKKKVVKETVSPEEIVTVVSDIKKATKKVAEPKKAAPAKKVAKKAVAKKPAAKKVAKKVVKKK